MRFFAKNILRYLSMTGLLVLLMICFPKKSAQALSLVHNHTDNCFTTETKLCNSHHIELVRYKGTAYCRICQKSQTGAIVQYMDICENNLTAAKEAGILLTCDECGRNSLWGETGPSSHEYSREIKVCEFENEEKLAEVELVIENTEWTNENVKIVAVSKDVKAGVGLLYDWGNGFSNADSMIAGSNGNYSVKVKSNLSGESTLSMEVTNIDKTIPNVTLSKSTEDWSESGIAIIVTASDEESGLAENAFSINGGEYVSTNSFNISKNGDYKISVRDRAGNVGEALIKISNIGRNPAQIAAEAEAKRRAEAQKEADLAKEAEAKLQAALAEKEKAEAEAKKAEAERKKAEAERKKAEAEAKRVELEKEQKEAEIKNVSDALDNSGDVTEPETTESLDTEKQTGTLIEVIVTTEDNPAEDLQKAQDESEATPNPEKTDETVAQNLQMQDEIKNYEEYTGAYYLPAREGFNSAFMGKTVLLSGVAIAVIGLLILSFFSYVYSSENGKKAIAARAKVMVEKNRVLVRFPKGKLKNEGRYLIYYSPWVRRKIKGLSTYVGTFDSETYKSADEGVAFTYHEEEL